MKIFSACNQYSLSILLLICVTRFLLQLEFIQKANCFFFVRLIFRHTKKTINGENRPSPKSIFLKNFGASKGFDDEMNLSSKMPFLSFLLSFVRLIKTKIPILLSKYVTGFDVHFLVYFFF